MMCSYRIEFRRLLMFRVRRVVMVESSFPPDFLRETDETLFLRETDETLLVPGGRQI
jgi:hypothetical protein